MQLLNTDDDRGQVGIGTLIVFIAMVLVAAIAAGVLVDTAGFLQEKAQQTGEDSTDQVSDNIQVVSKFGEIRNTHVPQTGGGFNTNKRVGNVTLLIKAGAGAGPIDMNDTTVQLVGDDGDVTIQRTVDDGGFETNNNDVDEPQRASFGLKEVSGFSAGDVNSEHIIEQNDQRLELEVNLDGNVSNAGGASVAADNTTSTAADNFLTDSEELTLRLTTGSGSTTTAVVNVPSTLSTKSSGDYVEV